VLEAQLAEAKKELIEAVIPPRITAHDLRREAACLWRPSCPECLTSANRPLERSRESKPPLEVVTMLCLTQTQAECVCDENQD
jgi:hypothetical protein